MRAFHTLAAFSIAATLSLSASADIITDWNGTAVEAGRSLSNPNPATYSIVIAHLAAYDAVNAIHPTGAPYLSDKEDLSATPTASVDAAVAQAFHDVLVALIPAKKASIDDALATSLAAIADDDAKTAGVAIGAASAKALLDARAADVINPTPAPDPFVGEDALGKWRPTPRENTANAPLAGNTPWWKDLAPFAIASNDAYDPGAPPALSSARYALDYLEVKQYGAKTGSRRSADQTAIAKFWAQQTHVPFNAIARSLSLRNKLSVEQNARLFALLNLALADSRVAVWQAKYKYVAWRPITAINYQDDDGNADTVPFPAPADPTGPTWLPLLETPNHPEYPSGHSGTGAAGAGVLAYWFGDDVSFTVGSDSSLGYTRSFTRLSDAAQENADSRIYGGIHFRYANEAGLKIGAQIAAHVTSTFLKETELPPSGEGGSGGADREGGLGGTTSEAGAPSEGGAGTSGGTSSGGTSSGGSAGTGAVPSGEAGEPAATEGGAPADGGAASGGSSGKGGSGGSKGDDDSGCSVAHPSGKSSSAAWLVGLLGLGLLRRRPRQR